MAALHGRCSWPLCCSPPWFDIRRRVWATASALTGRAGEGWGSSSRSSEPVSRPTALMIPPQVPLANRRGFVGGARWDDWHTGCHLLRAPQRRDRCASLSGAVVAAKTTESPRAAAAVAADVTPSAANGAAVEPMRALLCSPAISGALTGRCRHRSRHRRPESLGRSGMNDEKAPRLTLQRTRRTMLQCAKLPSFHKSGSKLISAPGPRPSCVPVRACQNSSRHRFDGSSSIGRFSPNSTPAGKPHGRTTRPLACPTRLRRCWPRCVR